jgi:ABC-2 type transport system permease protein
MTRVRPLLVALSRDWLRNREAVFFAFLFPVILLLIFSAVFGGGTSEFTVYVQNNDVGADDDPTDLSATFVEALNGTGALSVRPLDPDRNVTAWSRGGGPSGSVRVLVVPDGFAEDVRAGSARARRSVILDTLNRTGTANRTAIQGAFDAADDANATASANATGAATVTFMAASDDEAAPAIRGVVESVVARFNERAVGIGEPPARVEATDLGDRTLEGADYYLPALIAAVVMINGLITLPTVVAEFGADGTLKRLVATPLRKRDWILANVVQQTGLALVITGVMVVVARLAFGVTVVPGPLSLALVALGAVAFTSLGMALGSLVENAEAATSLGMAVALPTMFVSGVFWELDLMPGFLQTVATVTPIYHFHRGLRQLMVLETTEGTALPFAVLGIGSVLSLALAVRVTKWEDF